MVAVEPLPAVKAVLTPASTLIVRGAMMARVVAIVTVGNVGYTARPHPHHVVAKTRTQVMHNPFVVAPESAHVPELRATVVTETVR